MPSHLELDSRLPIFVFCPSSSDLSAVERRQKFYEDISLKPSTQKDYREFLAEVIGDNSREFAVCTQADAVLPKQIRQNIEAAVADADKAWGRTGWGLLGCAGQELCSERPLAFVRDGSVRPVPYNSGGGVPVSQVTGVICILNLAALREQGLNLPEAHLRWPSSVGYDFVLSCACYLAGLPCLVDSRLFVVDRNGADAAAHLLRAQIEDFYLRHFDDASLRTFYGAWCASSTPRGQSRWSDQHLRVLMNRLQWRPSLCIVVRSSLARLNMMGRLFAGVERLIELAGQKGFAVSLMVVQNNFKPEDEKRFRQFLSRWSFTPQVLTLPEAQSNPSNGRSLALAHGLAAATSDYLWFVDDDDFIHPEAVLRALPLLNGTNILIGDSRVFEEEWEPGAEQPSRSQLAQCYEAKNFPYCFSRAESFIPICSAIYPRALACQAFEKYRVLGDYYEDFALFLATTSQNMNIICFSENLTGISLRRDGTSAVGERDRTRWEVSYATYVSGIMAHGIVSRPSYEAMAAIAPTQMLTFGSYDRLFVKLKRVDAFLKKFPRLRSMAVRLIKQLARI